MIRFALFLLILAMVMPADIGGLFGGDTDDAPDTGGMGNVAGVVIGAATDLAGFCDRNPTTCEDAGEIFESLRAKAVYWSGELHGWLEANASEPTEAEEAARNAAREIETAAR